MMRRIKDILSSFLILSTATFASEKVNLKNYIGLDGGVAKYGDKNLTYTAKSDSAAILIPKNYEEKKEMFRSTWVASVENMHFPKKEVGSGKLRNNLDELKSDWLEILANHKKLNLNVVIYQVSPTLDALYPSVNRPWSHTISGKQGVVPAWSKDFDLMKWMIEETHKAGLEFHAWFNPYRVTHKQWGDGTLKGELALLSENNFAKKNPDLVYEFNGKLYLDPGEDKVTKHISDVVAEFLKKYDTDAIHFDDYFYPYNTTVNGKRIEFGTKFEDRDTFKRNPKGVQYIEDIKSPENLKKYQENVKIWRRENVNKMVISVKETIDKHNASTKNSVQWGISPFGIWEHVGQNIHGSNTPNTSGASNRDIYADTRRWIINEKIDYVIPQVYWDFASVAAPYAEITKWWSDLVKGKRTQLYIGHGDYKHLNAATSKTWENYEEIGNQLKFNQLYPNILGSAHFGYTNVITAENPKNSKGIDVANKHVSYLMNEIYVNIALTPSKPWLDKIKTKEISELSVKKEKGSYNVTFKDSLENDTRFYVFYSLDSSDVKNIKNSNILAVVGREKSTLQNYILGEELLLGKKYLGVSIKDKAGVESAIKTIKLN